MADSTQDVRQKALDASRKYRGGWLLLSHVLTSISEKETYREWGHEELEAYVKEELGLTKVTLRSLLEAYAYVKQHHPSALNTLEAGEVPLIPDFGVIASLSRAAGKDKVTPREEEELRTELFEKPETSVEVGKKVRSCASDDDVKRDVNSEIKAVQRLAKKLVDKLHTVTAFSDEVLEIAEKLAESVSEVSSL